MFGENILGKTEAGGKKRFLTESPGLLRTLAWPAGGAACGVRRADLVVEGGGYRVGALIRAGIRNVSENSGQHLSEA